MLPKGGVLFLHMVNSFSDVDIGKLKTHKIKMANWMEHPAASSMQTSMELVGKNLRRKIRLEGLLITNGGGFVLCSNIKSF